MNIDADSPIEIPTTLDEKIVPSSNQVIGLAAADWLVNTMKATKMHTRRVRVMAVDLPGASVLFG